MIDGSACAAAAGWLPVDTHCRYCRSAASPSCVSAGFNKDAERASAFNRTGISDGSPAPQIIPLQREGVSRITVPGCSRSTPRSSPGSAQRSCNARLSAFVSLPFVAFPRCLLFSVSTFRCLSLPFFSLPFVALRVHGVYCVLSLPFVVCFTVFTPFFLCLSLHFHSVQYVLSTRHFDRHQRH